MRKLFFISIALSTVLLFPGCFTTGSVLDAFFGTDQDNHNYYVNINHESYNQGDGGNVRYPHGKVVKGNFVIKAGYVGAGENKNNPYPITITVKTNKPELNKSYEADFVYVLPSGGPTHYHRGNVSFQHFDNESATGTIEGREGRGTFFVGVLQ